MMGSFYWLFLWNPKKINHQPLPMTQPKKYRPNHQEAHPSPQTFITGQPHCNRFRGMRVGFGKEKAPFSQKGPSPSPRASPYAPR